MTALISHSTRRSRLRRIEPVVAPTSSPRLRLLKALLRRRFAAEWSGILPEALVARAVDEAELQADAAGFPELLFPELAAEYVRRLSFP
jgi:hypothetical protein